MVINVSKDTRKRPIGLEKNTLRQGDKKHKKNKADGRIEIL